MLLSACCGISLHLIGLLCDIPFPPFSPPFVQPYLDLHYGATEASKILKELNERMLLMPRCEDFILPFCEGDYFPGHSHVQAKEHRNVMQVLMHLLHGLDENLVELACL